MNRNRSVVRWVVLALVVLCFSAASFAEVFISVRIGPPPLPVYAQPICPGPGYFWTPGYWAWNDDDGYYWVPGTWVIAPVGMLWTPGYWGWGGGFYVWHPGYWGPHVGFYGGINYGFGYTGVGFAGGEWRGNRFYYNRSVTNVSVTNVTNVYNRTVIVNKTTINNVSYNGGNGGIQRRPTRQEESFARERHEAPLSMQQQHERLAMQNRQNFARENHGRPAIAATARPADFSNRSVISARAAGGEYHPPAISPREARGPSSPGNRPFTPATSNNANRNEGRPATTPQDRSRTNEGFRPFNPPKSNAARPSGGNSAAPSQDKGRTNQGYRPFTPPTSNRSQGKGSANPTYNDHGNTGNNPMYEPKDRSRTSAPPSPSHGSQGSAPRHESAPPAPPRQESAPARHESAPPRHESAPPRHESAPPQRQQSAPRSAPKDEHRPPGKAR